MAKQAGTYIIFTAIGLAVLLFCSTYLFFGFYYETNDDQLITLLLQGITIQPPLQNMALYFLGWSQILVWLYSIAPAVPWYGLMLYGLLWGATVLAFVFLLRSAVRYNWLELLGWLLLFFLSSWLEHLLWFNYTRVPLLLTGTSFLWLISKYRHKNNWLRLVLAGILFLMALCIRPSAAILGAALVIPAIFLFSDGKIVLKDYLKPIFIYLVVGSGFFIYLQATQTPAARQYQRLDWLKSTVLDYQIYQPNLSTKADALAYRAIQEWLLADTEVVNEAFYARAGNSNLSYISKQVAPVKLANLGSVLVRDHFFVLALNAVLLLFIFRYRTYNAYCPRWLIGYQFYFWAIILALGIFLKSPPRVLTPCISLYTLVHLALYFKLKPQITSKRQLNWFLSISLLLLAGLQLYKVQHRANWQQQQQQKNEMFLAEVKNSFKGKLLVAPVLPDYFRSLSPFCNYNFGNNFVFLLTGWTTLDPAFTTYWQQLTGQPNYAGAVAWLATNKEAIWLLNPSFYPFLNQYFKTWHATPLILKASPHPLTQKYPVQVYYPATKVNP